MNENYEYSPAVFRALAEILEQVQADMEKITGKRYVPPVKDGKKRRRIRHV